MMRPLHPQLIVLIAVVLALATLAGCQPSPTSSRGQSGQSAQRRTDRGEGLLRAAMNQLRDLPSYVDTQLTPPVVILDSTKSGDGNDVLAICTENPDVADGLINRIYVPAGNSRFRALGVRPGDVLKYYVLIDPLSLEVGFAEQVAMDLTVAQVLDDHTLLIEGGLSAVVPEPAKIEVWRYVDDRLHEISEQLRLYAERRLPPLGWEPSADEHALNQIVVRLNQWLRQSQAATEWQPDPLLATLDPTLADDKTLTEFISAESLAAAYFQPHEGRLLQEAVWHRDIARWAVGDRFSAVERAAALFDWTIRNVQLDADEAAAPNRPWQTLMYGHGTAEQRAWVFALLARQQRLDVVVLELADSRFWLPALVDDGQLYPFDTRLGLPIPGPEGDGVATLAQLRADDSLLRQLDLDDAPYPVTADDLQRVAARVVADPFELSRRAKLVGERLTGDDQLVLTVDASELADRVGELPGIDDVALWDVPFHALRGQLRLGPRSRRLRAAMEFEPFAWRPELWKARLLHFQGRRRPIDDIRGSLLEMLDDHIEATRLYTSRSVRPPDRVIAGLAAPERRRVYTTAKAGATYWVGLLLFDDGKYDVAVDWLSRPELTAADSRWADGARYNLARAHEARGELDEAAAIFEADTSPQQHGNRLRAGRLRSTQ